VTWQVGERPDGLDSHGLPLAPRDHWDVRLVVAVVASGPKAIGSTAGMVRTAETCPLYPGWVQSAPADLAEGRQAVLDRDLARLGEVMEHSTMKMHATMIGTRPSVRYWKPASVAALDVVEDLRRQGTSAWATMDAGPNVKVLCEAADAEAVAAALRTVVPRVEILAVGGDARLA
jgi:diphosphomevalonate decarboxylase